MKSQYWLIVLFLYFLLLISIQDYLKGYMYLEVGLLIGFWAVFFQVFNKSWEERSDNKSGCTKDPK